MVVNIVSKVLKCRKWFGIDHRHLRNRLHFFLVVSEDEHDKRQSYSCKESITEENNR